MSSISALSTNRQLYVLDSWPIAEKLFKGHSFAFLEDLMDQAETDQVQLLLSEVNLGELFYLTAKHASVQLAEETMEALRTSFIRIVPIAAGDAVRAARLKSQFTISYADAFAADLAIRHSAALITGDADFLPLQSAGLLQLHWLGA